MNYFFCPFCNQRIHPIHTDGFHHIMCNVASCSVFTKLNNYDTRFEYLINDDKNYYALQVIFKINDEYVKYNQNMNEAIVNILNRNASVKLTREITEVNCQKDIKKLIDELFIVCKRFCDLVIFM